MYSYSEEIFLRLFYRARLILLEKRFWLTYSKWFKEKSKKTGKIAK